MRAKDEDRATHRPRTLYLLNQANLAMRSQLEQELRAIGMTGLQFTVLSVIGEREGTSSAQLSRRFFVTPQTMGEVLSGLERRGLLHRRESVGSKRILVAQLTEAGNQALAACDAIADRVERRFLSLLPEQDFQDLRRILRTFLTAARNVNLRSNKKSN